MQVAAPKLAINDLRLSRDGQKLISASADGTVKIWKMRRWQAERTWLFRNSRGERPTHP